MSRRLLDLVSGTILHPQWLTDRFHAQSKQCLRNLRNAVVVDIGSGNAGYLRLVDASNTLYTLDYPATNRHYQTAPMIYADARRLPIANDKVDAVFLFEVLEHVPETEKVLSEICRVLRPGGEFYISVPFIYPIHDAPNDYWRFTQYGITNALYGHGLHLTTCHAHGSTFVSALQLLNLAMLELCRDLFQRNRVLGLMSAALVYPVTIGINLVAWPLLHLPLGKAASFGYFIIARKKNIQDA